MKKEDVPLLNQLVLSLEQNMSELENAYSIKDFEGFNKIKNSLREINNKIGELIK